MDYQFASVLQLLVLSVFVLNFANAIIARDLLLTPKQGLQINGKSVYYAEEKPDILHNTTSIPWERTLKHVTFVTIFTNATAEAVAGNLSKLREYNSFLQSPYIRQNDSQYGRFGDIVMLASGRLEQDGLRNGSYRFIEGRCLYECAEERLLALWQVQKIRHRDTHRTYRYEMKYSVSPVRMHDLAGDLANDFQRDVYQTYIQKDDDYPQNFGYLSYAGEQKFAERRLDNVIERSFRQVAAPSLKDYERNATPLPQPTFISDRFLPPPPPAPPSRPKAMPNPDNLNIGEYIKGYTGTKATPKIEVYPNPASRMGYQTATTFRPAYNLKIIKPDNYLQPQTMAVRFPDNDQETYSSKLSAPLVTHHFHHHFFMPPSSSENSLASAEQQLRAPTATYYQQQPAVITPPPPLSQQQYTLNTLYGQQEHHHMPPAPQKVSIPIPSVEEQPQLLKQHLVQVTPVPPLRKPHVLQMFPVSIGPKIPLYIYPAPIEENAEEDAPQHANNNKPFRQSELMPNIRYSEPDPLYVNVPDDNSPQLESPPNQQEVAKYQRSSQSAQIESYETHSPAPDSIAAQLPLPAKGQAVGVSYNDDDYSNNDDDDSDEQAENQKSDDQEQHHSLKDINIATEKTSSSTVKTEATPRTEPTTTSARSSEKPTTTIETRQIQPCLNATTTTSSLHGDNANETTTTKISLRDKNSFISTSTTERPLHMVARAPAHRTTTEQPVLKWKPRRKANFTSRANKQQQTARANVKHEQQSDKGGKDDMLASMSGGGKNANELLNEIFEVLTQKSVSKSVSIKIGSNGEEIPVLEDDTENGVRRKIST